MNTTDANLLINRISTDNINKMLSFTHKFPTSGQTVIDELMVKTTWMDIRYESICILNDIFGCGYTPSDIAPLFHK